MELVLADARGLDDLRTYVGRAKAVDAEGAIRLQASDTTLAASVGVLAGAGLMAEGAVLGLRVMALGAPAHLDVTVSLASVTDRLARTTGTTLTVPPTVASAGWAAVAPPRSGWERVGTLSAEEVYAAARDGIAEVASGSPPDAGGAAVAALRRRVWSRPTPTTPPVPAGGAFAAYTLGFAPPGTTMTVWAHGRWTRLSGSGGHVLLRGSSPPT
jgi:hypothetical protein